MKKILILTLLLISFLSSNAQSNNPIVPKMSTSEVLQKKTPASVAYNFIIACLYENKHNIYYYSSTEFKQYLDQGYYDQMIASFHDSEHTKLCISLWKEPLEGCEIAVLYVQDENSSDYPEGSEKKVYINVVPSNEIGVKGFQDITRMYNTNVKVMLLNENGTWKVNGFK